MLKIALVGLALILVGAFLGHEVQTAGGSIQIKDVRWQTADGDTLSALLYVPESASPATPAPGILAVHGYINTRETQSGFAIEFARRGFVVLALDQAGHGYSSPPAFANGFGGPAGLEYLRGLSVVDPTRIGLEGHSMGGWTVLMAAAAYPDGYEAMVLEGSSTGTFGTPAGTPEFPRNLKLVFSLYDEFSGFMWDAPIPADIVSTPKLKQLFGTSETIVAGKLYGSFEQGSARELAMPAVTHPGDHLSTEAIGAAVDWFQRTLLPPSPRPQLEQAWYLKEYGTLLMLLGLTLLVLPLFELLAKQKVFQSATTEPVAAANIPTIWRKVAMFSTVVIPVLLFFPLQTIANLVLPASSLLPQQITNGVVLWAWGSGLVAVTVMWFSLRQRVVTLASLGLPVKLRVVASALLLALAVVGVLYLIVLATQEWLLLDYRFWVVALKSMSSDQIKIFIVYLPFFATFFLALSAATHLPDQRHLSVRREAARNALMLSVGFVFLLLAQYLPLFLGGSLLVASQPLLTIVALQFVPLLALIAIISTCCFRRTHNIYTGAFINTLLVTWYMVAGTATQALPFWSSM